MQRLKVKSSVNQTKPKFKSSRIGEDEKYILSVMRRVFIANKTGLVFDRL